MLYPQQNDVRNKLDLAGAWDQWQRPMMLTEFSADTMAGMYGYPYVMWNLGGDV